MGVHNIVDHRTNHHAIRVCVVFEDSWHDNTIPGATQFDEEDEQVSYCCIASTTVHAALVYAQQRWPSAALTMYLYDPDGHNYADYETLDVNEDGAYTPRPKIPPTLVPNNNLTTL